MLTGIIGLPSSTIPNTSLDERSHAKNRLTRCPGPSVRYVGE